MKMSFVALILFNIVFFWAKQIACARAPQFRSKFKQNVQIMCNLSYKSRINASMISHKTFNQSMMGPLFLTLVLSNDVWLLLVGLITESEITFDDRCYDCFSFLRFLLVGMVAVVLTSNLHHLHVVGQCLFTLFITLLGCSWWRCHSICKRKSFFPFLFWYTTKTKLLI